MMKLANILYYHYHFCVSSFVDLHSSLKHKQQHYMLSHPVYNDISIVTYKLVIFGRNILHSMLDFNWNNFKNTDLQYKYFQRDISIIYFIAFGVFIKFFFLKYIWTIYLILYVSSSMVIFNNAMMKFDEVICYHCQFCIFTFAD